MRLLLGLIAIGALHAQDIPAERLRYFYEQRRYPRAQFPDGARLRAAQTLDRTQPIQPALPGRREKASHDYVGHGTTALFAALDVATGKVIGACQRRH